MKRVAKPLLVPDRHYGAVRRLLRDKMADHVIRPSGRAFDLGGHDARDDV
jgi:hypothetical protein